jgi:hypothetical protein
VVDFRPISPQHSQKIQRAFLVSCSETNSNLQIKTAAVHFAEYCHPLTKPGETPDVPAQIVPKTRKFKRTRWHDVVSDMFKDSQYASRTFLNIKCWSQKGSTRRKSVKEA